MHGVHGYQRAQDAAGNDVADKMIIHRHKAEKHRNSKQDHDHATLWDGNHPYAGESEDSASVTRGEAADVVATLKRMKTVRAGPDERWVIMGPCLRPVATENVA